MIRVIALASIGLLFVGGCSEEEAQQAPQSVKKMKKKAQQAAAAPGRDAAPIIEYSYSPIGKRDPFRSYLADIKEQSKTDSRRSEETERFELDQYRLTGLITSTSQPKAMVEDPEGRGHILRIGARLGKNGGRVTKIKSDGIVVTEEFRAPTGERIRVPIEIQIPQEEGFEALFE